VLLKEDNVHIARNFFLIQFLIFKKIYIYNSFFPCPSYIIRLRISFLLEAEEFVSKKENCTYAHMKFSGYRRRHQLSKEKKFHKTYVIQRELETIWTWRLTD